MPKRKTKKTKKKGTEIKKSTKTVEDKKAQKEVSKAQRIKEAIIKSQRVAKDISEGLNAFLEDFLRPPSF